MADETKQALRDVGWAVKQMWNGDSVRRTGWNGKGMYLFMVPENTWSFDNMPCDTAPIVVMKTVDEKCVPWLCSQTDLLATDWEPVDSA